MNRRDFLKKAGAATALLATGVEAKAMVPPYDWPGEPTQEPVEGTECGKQSYRLGDTVLKRKPVKFTPGEPIPPFMEYETYIVTSVVNGKPVLEKIP